MTNKPRVLTPDEALAIIDDEDTEWTRVEDASEPEEPTGTADR